VKKILLTGSTGFIGSELLKSLSYNNLIYITLRTKNKRILKNKNIREIYFNNFSKLNDKLKKIKVDTVIHCATHYIKNHKTYDLQKLNDSNILFGNIILENLKIMNVKKFINFSTVWENFNGEKDNCYNLYSVYKRCFGNLINFYKKIFKKVKFFNLIISDTFGKSDKRNKIINILKTNYKKNLTTKIISKNLFINLLNVTDINNAIKLILNNVSKPGTYLLKNKKDYLISDLINKINNNSAKKIKIRWLSKKIIKEKIYKYKSLKNWKPLNSKIEHLAKVITQ
jgi:nucleoside-diphosphate-sugar epimerase